MEIESDDDPMNVTSEPYVQPALAAPAIANLFPGKVVGPDGVVTDKIRAILTPSLLVVYGEEVMPSGSKRVRTQFTVPIVSARPDVEHPGGWIATDSVGMEWFVGKGTGCGCSSPLKFMPSPPPVELPPQYG